MLFVVMMSPDIVMGFLCWCCLCCWVFSLASGRCVLAYHLLPAVCGGDGVFAPEGFDVRMLEAAKDLGASEFTICEKSFCHWQCQR